MNKGLSVFKSQNLTDISPEPLAKRWPSGLKLAEMTASECPGNELEKKIQYIIDNKKKFYDKKYFTILVH